MDGAPACPFVAFEDIATVARAVPISATAASLRPRPRPARTGSERRAMGQVSRNG